MLDYFPEVETFAKFLSQPAIALTKNKPDTSLSLYKACRHSGLYCITCSCLILNWVCKYSWQYGIVFCYWVYWVSVFLSSLVIVHWMAALCILYSLLLFTITTTHPPPISALFIIVYTCQHTLIVDGCGYLDLPENGQVILSGMNVGSIATYSCNSGFEVTGKYPTRTCQSDGRWSGTAPVCRPG